MMRLKIIKTTVHYHKDQIVNLPKEEGLALIKKGIAILTKDITEVDGNTK